MYYEDGNHGLQHDPFKAIVTPRPIGWISTVDANGVPNLAPYSFFNAMGSRPYFLAFASEQIKDSARNAQQTGEFVFSLCTAELADAMNLSCANLPPEVNEFEHAGLEEGICKRVKAPRVLASPASFECKTVMSQLLPDVDGKETANFMVIGQVVATHIDDRYIKDGRFDTALAQPLARCGYRDYSTVTELFELMRPGEAENGGKFKV